MKTISKIVLSLLLVISITGCSCVGGVTDIGLGKKVKHSFTVKSKGLTKETYYVMDRDAFSADSIVAHDRQRLFCSLQGLVNRNTANNRVALLIEPESKSELYWTEYMKNDGGPLKGMNRVDITTWEDFLSTFKNQLIQCGMILWDPNVPATANVAATICGLKGYLPVKDIDESVKTELTDLGVEVKETLTGMFKGEGKIPDTNIESTGSTKNDAYIWAMEQYMDDCSNRYMMCVPDGASTVSGNVVFENNYESKRIFGSDNIVCHDYGIAKEMFFIDLSPLGEYYPCDDMSQEKGTDLATLKKILQRRYDNAKGEFGCMVGMPPWQLKYTKFQDMGVSTSVDLENAFVKYLTQYNMYLDSDCTAINTSVYCQYKLKSSYKNGSKKVTEKYEENTIYVYYHIGDYETTETTVNDMLDCFNDENRGNIPLNWSINPGLADRIPMVFDYIYSNLSKNDTVSASNSGIGIIDTKELFIPEKEESKYQTEKVDPRTLPSGGEKFVEVSESYFNKFDIDIVGLLKGRVSEDIYGIYSQIAPAGCFHNDYSVNPVVYLGTGYFPTMTTIGNVGDYEKCADSMYNYWENSGTGNFLSVRANGWTPTQLVEITKALEKVISSKKSGFKVKVVNGYNFLDLAKQAKVLSDK